MKLMCVCAFALLGSVSSFAPASRHAFRRALPRPLPRHATRQPAVFASLQPSASDDNAASSSTPKQALAGITVALASLPTSVAFANIVGVSPLVGVWSSVVLGAVAPLLGARPGVVFGAAGVVAVPLAPLVAAHGPSVIALTTLIAATLELLFGLCRFGRFIGLVSDNVMAGFLNGLGMLLLKSQMRVFTSAPAIRPAAALAALTVALIQLLPKVPVLKGLPPSLGAVLIATAASAALRLDVATLADAAGASTFAGGLSILPRPITFSSLQASSSLLRAVSGPAASIALISLLETLLAAKVLDDQKDQDRGRQPAGAATADDGGPPSADPNRSCIAMAVGNVASALLGGFGGCGLIPQTLLAASSGGRSALSAVAYALAMGSFVLFAAPLVGKVPLPALAGVMLTVGAATLQWKSSWAALSDAASKRRFTPRLLALATASIVCYRIDMAAGIVAGVLIERALLGAGSKSETQS